MKLSSASEARRIQDRRHREPSAWLPLLVYALVIPLTVVASGLAGWYIATGETPTALAERLLQGPRISMAMPPRPGAEKPAEALLRPPAAVVTETSPPTDAPDKTPSAQPEKPAEKPAEQRTEKPAQTTTEKPAEQPAEQPAEKPAQPAAPAKPVSSFVAPPPPPPLAEPSAPPAGESLAPPAFAQLPTPSPVAAPLPPAPLPELLHQSPNGLLPIRAAGLEAWKVYARPIGAGQSKPGPKIAVVVMGLGLSRDATSAAIAKLPADVSLSFSPYGSTLDGWIKRARDTGHEALLDLPLEPPDFPQHDAGPLAILASHSPGEAITRLDVLLAKATGYVGVAASLRSPVTATDSWALMLHDLKDRGLLLIGNGLVGVEDQVMPAAAAVTLVADDTPYRSAIDAKLARLLLAAKRDGSAIVTLSARPVSFERLLAFLASLPENGVTLVPVSALAKSPP